MRIKLFTHTDMDGAGCAIVGNLAFGSTLDVQYCGYGTIDEKVENFIKSGEHKKYSAVFITDISVSKEVSYLVDETIGDKTNLIDHHNTASWLNEYDWANVTYSIMNEREGREQLESGTSLFYKWCIEKGFLDRDEETDILVETIRRYDSWEWKRIYVETFPNRLNTLFSLKGIWNFVERFSENPTVVFTKSENEIADIEEKKIERYIDKKRKELSTQKIFLSKEHVYDVGVIFADQYISETGNVLCEERPHIDFIIMINAGAGLLSLRRSESKNDIDLGAICKEFWNGGGHPPAAGGRIKGNYNDLIKQFLRK